MAVVNVKTASFLKEGSNVTLTTSDEGKIITIAATSGASAFTDLTDVPSSYSGQGTKVVSVKATEDGLEFTAAGSGDVTGPASSVDTEIVVYSGTTGKIIKNTSKVLTTVGGNIAALTNPSAVTFIRINADNSVTARSAANFLSDIGAEDVSNKTDTAAGNTASSTKYLSVKGYYDYLIGFTWLSDSIWGTWIAALTGKTTPVDADYSVIMDSADSNKAKKLSWANLKATLKTYFDTLYASLDNAAYWKTLPGSPTRSSNTVLTITDTSNANLYDLKFNRGTVLKWTDTTVKQAMVVSATYSSNTVTITIIGDVLSGTATMNTFKYALEKADKVTFAIAGTMATGSDLSRKWKADKPYRVFGADGLHGVAGTTNATTYELLKNGSANSMFTTDISIASAATVGNGYTADDNTSLALDDVVSLSCNTVSTTAPIDVYIDMFIFPTYNQYL